MNPKARLIGLTGPAGCGKSTIARALVQHENDLCYWKDATRHRFAGPLKAMLRTLGLTEAQVDGDEKETPCELLGGKTARAAMQLLGTEWGRNMIGPNLWVRATMLRVDVDLAESKLVVIDDVRFDNEVDAIHERGGIVVSLIRDVLVNASTSAHASEAGVSPHLVDVMVPNQDAPDSVARFILNQLVQRDLP
jgi:cytidylate kinase